MGLEMKKARLLFVLMWVLLAACSGVPAWVITDATPGPVPSATLLPGYIATAQEAEAGAQATTSYGKAQMAELEVKGTALALELTAAAATQVQLEQQTAQAITATAAQATGWRQETVQAAAETDAAMGTQQAGQSTQVSGTQQAVLTESANAILVASAEAEVARIRNEQKAAEQTLLFRTWGYRVLGVVLAVLLLGGLGGAFYGTWQYRDLIASKLGLVQLGGPDGKPYMPKLLPDGSMAWVDVERSAGPVVIVRPNGAVEVSGMVELGVQNQITARAQAAALLISNNVGGQPALPQGELLQQTMSASAPTDSAFAPADVNLPPEAAWSLLSGWRGGSLPLGVGANGLITLDPEANAHLLVAGTTGSGKTRFGLRPVITEALASGWLVAIFDRSGLDFLPFRNHPNGRLVMLEDPQQAIGYLSGLYGEIQRRFKLLASAGVSTWGRLPGAGARVLAVFDEFSNLSDSLTSADRDELWRWARMVAAEGRKAGIHLMLALQDPTHRSIDLRIRRNMTPVAFRVRDTDASRVILNAAGAETLPPRQFITVNGFDSLRGVAFGPSDEEITSFLAARPVQEVIDAEWLEVDQEMLPANSQRDETVELAEQIRELWKGKASKRAMAMSRGKTYAGAFADKLDAAIRYLELSATTATTTSPDGK
jgi:hypothetical protein